MNHAILIGRLTKDPSTKQTQTGKSVTSFTLAVNRTKTETDFISCVAWEKTSEIITQYARKGSQIAVEGQIATRSYDDKDKRKVFVTEVVARNVQLLDKVDEKKDEPKFDTGPIVVDPNDDLPF